MEQERRVLMLWHAISELAPPDENPLGWAVGRTGMPFRRVDWARRTRNRVAHPDGNPLNPRDVARAAEIFEDLLRRLGATPPELASWTTQEQSAAEATGHGRPAHEAQAGAPARNGRSSSDPTAESGTRRRPPTLSRSHKVPAATILLLVVGVGCTLSLWLALAGLPALVLAAVAMSKVYTDFPGAQRLTRIGWITFAMLFLITLAGLALRYVTQPISPG